MAPFAAHVLRLLQAGQNRPAWPRQGGPETVLGIKSSRAVAVLAGGAFPPPSRRINGERSCSLAVSEDRRSSVPWATC